MVSHHVVSRGQCLQLPDLFPQALILGLEPTNPAGQRVDLAHLIGRQQPPRRLALGVAVRRDRRRRRSPTPIPPPRPRTNDGRVCDCLSSSSRGRCSPTGFYPRQCATASPVHQPQSAQAGAPGWYAPRGTRRSARGHPGRQERIGRRLDSGSKIAMGRGWKSYRTRPRIKIISAERLRQAWKISS